mgnify:CR=1 FL=1
MINPTTIKPKPSQQENLKALMIALSQLDIVVSEILPELQTVLSVAVQLA